MICVQYTSALSVVVVVPLFPYSTLAPLRKLPNEIKPQSHICTTKHKPQCKYIPTYTHMSVEIILAPKMKIELINFGIYFNSTTITQNNIIYLFGARDLIKTNFILLYSENSF